METFGWVLIAFLIIVVIVVVAWILHIYFNRNRLIDVNGGGGDNGPVPDNFSSLYKKLQPLVKTMDGQVNTMTKRFEEMNSGSTCKAFLKEIGLTSLYDKFKEEWAGLKSEATLPVSTIFNSTIETLLDSATTTSETFKEVGKAATTGGEGLFCGVQRARNFIDAGKEAAPTLEKIDKIVIQMAAIAREGEIAREREGQ